MAIKEKKSAAELRASIMGEIREHSHWSDIIDITVVTIPQYSADRPNWDGTFTLNGAMAPPEGAFQIVRKHQSKFDLA
jgi:hypothetical protein